MDIHRLDETKERAIYLLNKDQFAFYWEEISDCLDKTDFGQFYTKEWLIQEVETADVQAWALSDGSIRVVLFTRICDYPCGKVLQLFWGYGTEVDRFLEIGNDMMDKAATIIGATKIEIVGRKGWIRKMKSFGFEIDWYVISRPVGRRREH